MCERIGFLFLMTLFAYSFNISSAFSSVLPNPKDMKWSLAATIFGYQDKSYKAQGLNAGTEIRMKAYASKSLYASLVADAYADKQSGYSIPVGFTKSTGPIRPFIEMTYAYQPKPGSSFDISSIAYDVGVTLHLLKPLYAYALIIDALDKLNRTYIFGGEYLINKHMSVILDYKAKSLYVGRKAEIGAAYHF
jgi:hypothetical protein